MGNEKIQSGLLNLMESQHEVELMSFYQSLPLTYRGMITEVGEDQVTLIAQPPDSVCLAWEKKAYILAPEPLELLEADVLEFDVVSGTVKLHNLRYGGSQLGHRMITRVIPKEPLVAELRTGGVESEVMLINLSIQGAGLQLDLSKSTLKLQRGQTASVTLVLPDAPITAQGRVQALSQEGEMQYFSLIFDEQTTTIRPIWQYVSRRRMEILQEVQDKYLQAYMEQAAGQ